MFGDPFSTGDSLFTIVPFIIFCIFIFVIGVVLFQLIRWLRESYKNAKSPVTVLLATVVDKRMDVSYHHNQNNTSTSSTTYYITFQMADGERLELRVKSSEYGQLIVGDYGRLSHQGTWYNGFQRIK